MLKCILVLLLFVSGCVPYHPPIELNKRTFDSNVKASLMLPERWYSNRHDTELLYSHQQWTSITDSTAVGIVRINVPTNADMIIWFVKRNLPDGKPINRWKDKYGREWIEGESDKFHGMAYFDRQWIVYAGYRKKDAVDVESYQKALDAMLSVWLDN